MGVAYIDGTWGNSFDPRSSHTYEKVYHADDLSAKNQSSEQILVCKHLGGLHDSKGDIDVSADQQEIVVDEVAPLQELTIEFLSKTLSLASSTLLTAYKSHKPTPCTTPFHGFRVPPISIQDYLSRMHHYFRCSDSCFIASWIYLERLLDLHKEFQLDELCIHRLLAVGVIVSAKFFDDAFCSNAYYAKVCGLKLDEVNSLEATFLRLINWQVGITAEVFEEYHHRFSASVN